jgi:hypothetical protein
MTSALNSYPLSIVYLGKFINTFYNNYIYIKKYFIVFTRVTKMFIYISRNGRIQKWIDINMCDFI